MRQPSENGSTYDPAFTVEVCDTASSATKPKCETKTTLHMTEEYWHGDRAMRESGYDLSFRFGPYGAGAHHFAPVCLNSLLYKAEKDMETMARILGRAQEAKQWSERAATRAATMQAATGSSSRAARTPARSRSSRSRAPATRSTALRCHIGVLLTRSATA